jgi:hypothetical protein
MRFFFFAPALAFVLLNGCTRASPPPPPPPPPDPPPAACTTTQAAPLALRRLTSDEYDAAARALLGTTSTPGRAFPREEGQGFSTTAAAQTPSTLLAEAHADAAEALAAEVDLAALLPCAVDDACAPRFIREFGRRAFRRALADDEAARLQAFFTTTRQAEDVDTSYRLLLQVFLQAPQFLFALESRAPGPLPGEQVATRLARFLWAAPPDDALLDAAKQGSLDTADGVAAQARRMLDDPRARDGVRRFHLEWLGVTNLPSMQKADRFPTFEALKPSMVEEVARFGAWATLDDGHAASLFTARTTFVDAALGELYGFTGLEGLGFRQVSLANKQRGGLLTLPGVMASWAKADQSAPVQRGRFVRERLMCETLVPPPGNVMVQLPPATFGTARERLSQHSADPACAGCHRLTDPVGLGLEKYDAIGAFRNDENGLPIDARGEIIGSKDADGTFDGALQLGQKLADSASVRSCVARQWFRYGLGRHETDADACSFEGIDAAFAAGDLRALLVAIASSDAFRLAAPEEAAP